VLGRIHTGYMWAYLGRRDPHTVIIADDPEVMKVKGSRDLEAALRISLTEYGKDSGEKYRLGEDGRAPRKKGRNRNPRPGGLITMS